ncbi:hypothetical protein [Paenibacillus polymyxa]|uniref:hypothetical protein n=1 Tax=Paenibacillus polymyxa TaxID=1406 RepID=UPI002AB4CDBA|nr:hypothetical protein [Paenibacillus polymyxa]MDY8021234.1 hypothetical protein [Paenibacillus polymyxa]
MGSGKTSAAIQMMNNDTEHKYIFITPFLDEIDRIKHACPNKRFFDPKNYNEEGHFTKKQDSFHDLLAKGGNIASTHALFKQSNEETRELIQAGNYVLVLDEVMDIVEYLTIKKSDKDLLFDNNLIYVDDDGYICWNNEDEKAREYDGKFNDIKNMANNRNLLFYHGTILIWTFPHSIFNAFKEVYILTYKFSGQIQKYYYDLNNIEYEYFHINHIDSSFTIQKGKSNDKEIRNRLKTLIHIYEGTLNDIGKEKYSLSNSWYEKRNQSLIRLKNNVSNYFKHKMKAKSNQIIWTTFKNYQSKISSPGYQRSFVSCNIRATNQYKDRTYLAYTTNRFMNPIVEGFFKERKIEIDQDTWATGELIQWIWRSAIRDNGQIHIYIPSQRMRDLLLSWLDE